MGLLDSVMNTASGLMNGDEGNGKLLDAAVQLVKDHPDGLSGVVDQFRNGGLADAVNSWVGTGENQPISSEDIQQMLGSTRLGNIANSLGITSEQVSSGLATVLPELINHLTPNGTVDSNANPLMEAGLSLLKSKLFG
jgi:uncharacterized protein YidB (DUF937 family)